MTLHQPITAAEITRFWKTDSRWKGITRPYAAKDVVRLRGTLYIEYTLARLAARGGNGCFRMAEPIAKIAAIPLGPAC